MSPLPKGRERSAAWRAHGRLGWLGALLAAAALGQGRYLDNEDFIAAGFPRGSPEPRTLWITNELREPIEKLLGHRFTALRLRYWAEDATTAWIIDEVGKEQPITIGVTVHNGAIETLRVLEFRESRGFEVRYPFFTDQFRNGRLDATGNIDQHIDGITGATLSVRAVTRVARLALLLDEHVSAR